MTTSSWPARFFGLFGPLDDFDNLLWAVRLCPLVSAVCLLLANTLFKTGIAHRVALGIAVVQLLLLAFYMFRAKNVVIGSGQNVALFNAIWIFRILPIVAAACVVLSEIKNIDFLRGLGLGMSAGFFITLFTVAFRTSKVNPSNLTPRDEFQQLHLQ